MINDDIDAIIQRGEERTQELNSKYEGLNLDDLNNFKSDASVQQWEGEDFRPGVRFFSLFMAIMFILPLKGKESIELQSIVAVQARAENQLFR